MFRTVASGAPCASLSRQRRMAAAAGLSLALLMTGCGSTKGSNEGPDAPDREATLRLGVVVTKTLDPADVPEAGQSLIATWPVYDRLLTLTESGEYAPMLATEWAFSGDGKTLSLTLREGVTFSNGEKFDAAAVKANLDRYRTGASAAAQLTAPIDQVEVLDEQHVALRLKSPSRTVLNALAASTGGAMIAPKALAGNQLATHPVGTGAYVLESYQPGQQVVYKRRTDAGGIWDAKTGTSARIKLTTYPAEAGLNALRGSQIDATNASTDTANAMRAELDSGRLVLRRLPANMGIVSVFMNRTSGPLADVRVRQAVNHAIDRESLVKAFADGASPRTQALPKGIVGFDDKLEKAYPYDPAKAKQLLAEAGYAKGVDLGEFLVGQSGAIPEASQAIQAQLAEVGIKMTLRARDILQLITDYSKTNAAGMVTYISTPSIEAATWMHRLYVNPVWSPAGPPAAMKPLLEGLDDARLSDEERAAKAIKVNEFAVEQALYAPLWQGNAGWVMSSKLRPGKPGELPNGVFIPDFRYLYLTK